MTSIEWQRWCRLCAGSQDVIVPLYGLNTTSEIIERANKYLKLSISADADDDESLPQYVCKSCADYVEQLDTFAIQCARVQDLFFSLAREEPTEDNITLIRNIFLNNSDEIQDHKDFEIVPVEPEIDIEKPSGKTRSSLNKKAKAAAAAVGPEPRSKTRGRPKKCEKTIPRIRIRALPSPPPLAPLLPPLIEKIIVKKEAIKKETAKKESTKKEATKKEVVKKEVTKKETAKKEATKKDVAKSGEQNTLVGAAKRKAKTPQSIVPKKRKEAAPPKKKERVKPVKVVKAVIERPREKATKKIVYKSDDSEEDDDDDEDDDDNDEDYKEEKSEEKIVKDEAEEKEKETEDTEKIDDMLDIKDDIIKEENDEFDIEKVTVVIKEENEEQEPENDDDEKVSSKKLKKAELKALLPSLYHFKCHVCDKVCKNWNSLGTHCKENHKETPQITCYCGKILSTRTAIIEHRARHTDSNMFKCDKCEKSFHRKSLLNVHQMSHVPKEQQPYVCCKCARRFHCEALLKNHERVHLPKEERLQFQCEICQKMFCSKSAVAAHHKAVHLGERPFVCHLCGHSFTSKGILQEHLTTHSDDAPWKCTKCEKCFKTKYRLKIHMDTHRETPYQCPKCPIQLSTRRTLRMHLVVHTDVKAYQCPICGKAFRRSKDLKNHSNLHTGRQPYTCPFCLRTFANGSNCRSHKRRMHPEQLRLMEASGGVWPDESSQKKTPEEEAAAANRNENVNNAGPPPPPNLPPPLPPPVPLVVENNKTDDGKGNLNVNTLNNSQIPEAEPRKADYPVTSVNNFSSSFLSFATTNDKRLTPVKPPPNVPMRPNFNQHFMEPAAGPHGYSSGHEQDNSSSSASPSFPGNPLIHHPFMFNRSIDP